MCVFVGMYEVLCVCLVCVGFLFLFFFLNHIHVQYLRIFLYSLIIFYYYYYYLCSICSNIFLCDFAFIFYDHDYIVCLPNFIFLYTDAFFSCSTECCKIMCFSCIFFSFVSVCIYLSSIFLSLGHVFYTTIIYYVIQRRVSKRILLSYQRVYQRK